jgi:3-oxoacyl-[acyl-carrier-protein] synthase II
MEESSHRKAVLTGFGAVSPLGHDVEAFWQGLLAGRCGLGPIKSFDTTSHTQACAGEVKEFLPESFLSPDEAQRLDRVGQYALVAAHQALAGARLEIDRVDRDRVGVILATTLGSMPIGEVYQRSQRDGVPFEARQLLHFPYYASACRLARELGVRGPVVSPSIACASGTQAVGMALELIRRGQGDAFVVGGVEVICEFVISGFNSLRATTAGVVRPFDARRDGLQLGEGAAVLIVESVAHAQARAAR